LSAKVQRQAETTSNKATGQPAQDIMNTSESEMEKAANAGNPFAFATAYMAAASISTAKTPRC
jgi:hypothetical protein